jgi:xeroderma pigmentosum group C-complementing protein
MSRYVLTRHLKQNQVIDPPPPDTKELGKFRGESVYPRSSVVSLKTAENWMRSEGRTVKAGSQALKLVKIRAGTVGRMRELEVLKDELRDAGELSAGLPNGAAPGGEVMQGLYSRKQTELYKPDPVVNVSDNCSVSALLID